MNPTTRLALALVMASLAGCDDETDSPRSRRGASRNDGTDPAAAAGIDATKQACSTRGQDYVGFGQKRLVTDRVEAPIGADRVRVKPVSALRGEYSRVLGQTPRSLDALATAYGGEQDRWFREPVMSAVAIASGVGTAFEACLAYTASRPELAAAPTAETAASMCALLERNVWSRTPSAAETDACRDVAVVDSASETDPRRRWAYVCGAVVSAAGFVTY